MGFWNIVVVLILYILLICAVLFVVSPVYRIKELVDRIKEKVWDDWLPFTAFSCPLVFLVIYLWRPSLAHFGLIAHFLPFEHFPIIPLSRYPTLFAIALACLFLNWVLFHVRFRTPPLRLALLLTEPVFVVNIVLLGSSFYLQYYLSWLQQYLRHPIQFLHPTGAFEAPAVVVGIVGGVFELILLAIFVSEAIFRLILRPVWRALTLRNVVARTVPIPGDHEQWVSYFLGFLKLYFELGAW